MKTILIVTDAWHPQINGVVTVIQKTKEHLEKRGYTVHLIEPSQFTTIPLPFYPEIRLSLMARRNIEKTIETTSPDYIHIMTEGPLGMATRRYCIKHKLNFTTSYHTNFDRYADTYITKLSHIVLPLLKRFHNKASRTMVATPSLATFLMSHGFNNIVVVPLGVDTERFRPLPKTHSLPSPVFTLFGRVARDKNPEEFFTLNLPGTKLVIGDGPEHNTLKKKYGTTATFVGFKKHDALVQLLSDSDVLVFTSLNDTFGLTILEAMACGVPVAAHNVMGPRDLIENGVDGVLDDNLEKAALAALTLNRENCRTKALSYSWERSVDLFVDNLVPSHNTSQK